MERIQHHLCVRRVTNCECQRAAVEERGAAAILEPIPELVPAPRVSAVERNRHVHRGRCLVVRTGAQVHDVAPRASVTDLPEGASQGLEGPLAGSIVAVVPAVRRMHEVARVRDTVDAVAVVVEAGQVGVVHAAVSAGRRRDVSTVARITGIRPTVPARLRSAAALALTVFIGRVEVTAAADAEHRTEHRAQRADLPEVPHGFPRAHCHVPAKLRPPPWGVSVTDG
ncbi:hypothetical protein COEX109129_14300 [Corallococcus exiguus]